MRPNMNELYNNLELMITLYSAEGLPAAKARLNSIVLMIHEVKGVEREILRTQRDILNNRKYLSTINNFKEIKINKKKNGTLNYNKNILVGKKYLKTLTTYRDKACQIIDTRLAKLPELAAAPVLSRRPNMRYIKKMFSQNFQARRFKTNIIQSQLVDSK